MDVETLDGHYGRRVTLDVCHGCHALWLDGHESLQLTPGAVLALFRLMHERRGPERRALASRLGCPRCRATLVETGDLQGATRFHYARCPREHGRFQTFFQFLREKRFVRSLGPDEVAELRGRVATVSCSNCGAAVSLDQAAACRYCRTPVSLLDPRQLERTVAELQAAEERRRTVDPDLPVRLMMDRLRTERYFRRLEGGGRLADLDDVDLADPFGLVEAGVGAVARALRALF
jgi:hypothetical protein